MTTQTDRGQNRDFQLDKSGLWDRIWRDHRGRIVIYQQPNIWLIAWALFDIISIFAPYKRVAGLTWSLGAAALAVWALLELFKGVNYFRRALGLVVLVMIVASLFRVGL